VPASILPSSFIFSQSSLQDFSDCPRRFQLRFIDQLQWPAIETEPALENERHQLEGQLFHRLVQQHLIGLPVEKLTRMVNTPNLSRWWENYINYQFNLDGYSLHTELTLLAPVKSYRLMAKYDLVAVKPNQSTAIYDWKTYHKRPRDEWMAARLQTRVYRAMLVKAGSHLNEKVPIPPEQIEMIYWYSDHPSEPARFPYTSTQYTRDWENLAGLIEEIANHGHFQKTDDEKKCAYCPYRSFCNRGDKAGMSEDLDEDASAETEISLEQIAEIEY
jgi:CRISPR/Cas system-associated exonuclease Cas4 (RecB family)